MRVSGDHFCFSKCHYVKLVFNEIAFYSTAREVLPQWDKQIQSLCYQVNGIIEKIGLAEPDFMVRVLEEPMAH